MTAFFKKLFGSKKEDEFSKVPAGVCPNCWGDQEYGNIIREKYKDIQIEVNNRTRKHAFIQDFIVTHLNGITLKSSLHGLECPTCKIVHEA
ncbi:hypothetical protein [Spongiimicrobium salis]|uniref:hypothetical protein n=1 Tax=Spongiimicrobium salis TaxID=1667022 RepID=UPI00374D7EDD